MSRYSFHLASLVSSNTIALDFPYNGPQHGSLVLQVHKGTSSQVRLDLERGQFLCSSWDGCTVKVRFDDGDAMTLQAAPPRDHGTTTLFLDGYSRFMARLTKAKRDRISAGIFRNGNPAFDFDVRAFDPTSYARAPARSATRSAKFKKKFGCDPRNPGCVGGDSYFVR